MSTILTIIASSIFALIVFGNIFLKAGFSRWYGLAMAVPFLNLVAIIWLAFTTWPIEEKLLRSELNRLR